MPLILTSIHAPLILTSSEVPLINPSITSFIWRLASAPVVPLFTNDQHIVPHLVKIAQSTVTRVTRRLKWSIFSDCLFWCSDCDRSSLRVDKTRTK